MHPETVARVLAQAGLPRLGPPQRPSEIDPYWPFIREMLGKFPTLTVSYLHAMAWERGYRGGKSRFRAVIACHRAHPKAEAYLRLRTLPGEQAQCDCLRHGAQLLAPHVSALFPQCPHGEEPVSLESTRQGERNRIAL